MKKISPASLPKRNIGSSVLPSCGYNTLDIVAFNDSTIAQVVPKDELDTYHAILIRDGMPPLMMASHPNGYSCKCLIDRMKKGDNARTLGQLDYIKDCGGDIMDREEFISILNSLQFDKDKSTDYIN